MNHLLRKVLLGSALLTAMNLAQPAWAQQSDHTDHTDHASHAAAQGATAGAGQVDQNTAAHDSSGGCSNCSMMQNQQADGSGAMMQGQGEGGGMMDHMAHMQGMMAGGGDSLGQDALSAIRAVVSKLEADPATDWSSINIDALRNHLVDMQEVAMNTEVETTEVEGGATFQVTGRDRTLQAIRNMVPMHVNQLGHESDWTVESREIRNGYQVTVTATTPAQVAKIRALGFYGFMVAGEHHADHHLAIVGAQPGAMSGSGGHSH
jgi:hypothetical protein